MEIKRKIEMAVVVNRRYVLRPAVTRKQMTCAECGAPMLAIEQAANLLDITQRRIFQIIETGAAHFTETATGALMICLPSLMTVLDDQARNNQTLSKISYD